MSDLQHTFNVLNVITEILTFHRETGALGRKLFTKKKKMHPIKLFALSYKKSSEHTFLSGCTFTNFCILSIHPFLLKYYDNT